MLDFLKERKPLVIAIALIVLVTIMLPMVRCSSLAQVEEEYKPADEQQTISVVIPDEEDETQEEEVSVYVSDRQMEMIDAYDKDVKELVGLLQNNVWTANKDTSTITFTDRSFTESANNSSVTTTFAICGIEKSSDTITGVNGESETTEDTTVTLMFEDGTYGIMHVCMVTSTSSPTPALTVSSNDFKKAKSYIRTKAASGVSVEGLNEDARFIIDQKEADLQKYLSEYCSVYYPTASVAKWDEKLTANYNSNIVELSFTLNNLGNSHIAVSYDLAYGKFGVGGGM